ncbi:MAG: DUF4163 domain-containing protein [Deltaproteobacteria bacterium]|jgi:hypothetical protein|nr:DUF4163 domain-containing protein [Deltaproteobacteria bacterium]
MKIFFSLIIAATLAVALSLTLDPAPLAAQKGRVNRLTTQDELGNTFPSKGFGYLSAETIQQNTVYEGCATAGFSFRQSYPALTGDRKVDTLIRNAALTRYYRQKYHDADTAAPDKCPADSYSSNVTTEEYETFKAFSPSPGYLSVLYDNYTFYAGAAHGYQYYHAETYLIGHGRAMTLTDLFPDLKKSLPLLWKKLSLLWCGKQIGQLPSFYGEASCPANGQTPLPNRLRKPDLTLDDLGHPVLTPQGLAFHLGSDECFSHGDGDQNVLIPKESLLTLGVRPGIWP